MCYQQAKYIDNWFEVIEVKGGQGSQWELFWDKSVSPIGVTNSYVFCPIFLNGWMQFHLNV